MMNKAIKGSNRKLGTVAPATPLKKKKFELERKTIWVPVKDLTPNVDTVNAKPPFEVRLKVMTGICGSPSLSFCKIFGADVKDNNFIALWIENKGRAVELGHLQLGDTIVVTSPFKMREINSQYDGNLMHSWMIKVIRSTKLRVEKADDVDGSGPFICQDILSRPVVDYVDVSELLNKDLYFSKKSVVCVDCYVHPSNAFAVQSLCGTMSLNLHVFNPDSRSFLAFKENLSRACFAEGARVLLLACQASEYQGQRQLQWVDSTSAVLSALEKGDVVNSSVDVVKTIEEEGVFTPKNTAAFLRGEKRCVCKICGMPAVGYEYPEHWVCFSQGCDGRGKECIKSSHYLLGNLKTNSRFGLVYLEEEQVTSLYGSKKDFASKEGIFALKLRGDKFVVTSVRLS